MASYRKVEFEMARGNGYGQYLIIGTYGGKDITVHTTNSEAFDWINDDSNPAMNKSARKFCYDKIVYAARREDNSL